IVIDSSTLHVYGFNYTKLAIDKIRSLGIVTRDRRLVQEAMKLFEADACRQPYSPSHPRFVVSPENSREALTAFIRGARKQLLIYDVNVQDRTLIKLLEQQASAGVDVRV